METNQLADHFLYLINKWSDNLLCLHPFFCLIGQLNEPQMANDNFVSYKIGRVIWS